MGRSQRRKGHDFERQVAQVFRGEEPVPLSAVKHAIWPDAQRGLGQARFVKDQPRASDVEGTPWRVETKKGAATNIKGAMRQVIADGAAAKDPRPPLVVSMDDRAEPVVTMRLADFVELIWKQQHAYEIEVQRRVDAFNANREGAQYSGGTVITGKLPPTQHAPFAGLPGRALRPDGES
jgi:hypothetical protein